MLIRTNRSHYKTFPRVRGKILHMQSLCRITEHGGWVVNAQSPDHFMWTHGRQLGAIRIADLTASLCAATLGYELSITEDQMFLFLCQRIDLFFLRFKPGNRGHLNLKIEMKHLRPVHLSKPECRHWLACFLLETFNWKRMSVWFLAQSLISI